jgi:hypothetical protein
MLFIIFLTLFYKLKVLYTNNHNGQSNLKQESPAKCNKSIITNVCRNTNNLIHPKLSKLQTRNSQKFHIKQHFVIIGEIHVSTEKIKT